VCISPFSHTYHMPHSSHPPWFHHSKTVWWGVQFVRLLIVYFSLVSICFLPLRPPIPPQHPALPLLDRTCFMSTQNSSDFCHR
jgi:hypothetical protein